MLTSDLLGTKSATVAIESKQLISSFEGVDVASINEASQTIEVQAAEEKNELTAFVSSFSASGSLVIKFTEPLVPLKDLRLLTAKESTVNDEKRSNLEIEILPIEDQTSEQVAFTWTPVKFEES